MKRKPVKKLSINHNLWHLPKWAREDNEHNRYRDMPATYYKEYIDYIKRFNAAVDAVEKLDVMETLDVKIDVIDKIDIVQ